MYTKYKIVPFCPCHFVRTILSSAILSVYHFVHTILTMPFCPLPFCPVTLVTDQMSGLTLGLPWLRRYHLIWKLCDNWVTLDNQIVDLYTSTTENECSRVEVDATRQEIASASRPAPQKPTVETTLDERKEARTDDRPATAVAMDNSPANSAVQPITTSVQPLTNTAAISMSDVTPTVSSAPITATLINGSKNLDQEYKQKELERGIDKNLTRARMENVQENVFNVNVLMQNVEQGLRQREMALQSAGGSPTSDVRPGSAQAYATSEHVPLPSKLFVTQTASSSHRLGYTPAYATQGACMFVKRRKVVNKSYLVTDPTNVLRRGLLCLRLKRVRWKRREKLVSLHFSANGCR